MSWFRAHLRREWGEHRAVLLGLLVAVPVLTASAFVAFGGAGIRMATLLPEFVGAAAMLAALSLSTEAFAGERSRGTIDGLRRLPGGLRRAFVGKVVFLPAAILAVSAWTFLCFATACAVFPGTRRLADVAAEVDGRLVFALLAAFAFAAWVLLASTWVPRGATAVTLAVGVPAVLLAPAGLLWGEQTRFLHSLVGALPWAVAGLASLAVVGAALGWIRGLRHVGRLGAVTLLTVPLVLGPVGVAYAVVRDRFEAWRYVDPRDEDAILEASIGVGGRHAFVNLRRGDDWTTCRPLRVDLSTGEAVDVGPVGTMLDPVPSVVTRAALTATRGLLRRVPTTAKIATAGRVFVDGATGADLGCLLDRPMEPRLLDLVRAETRRIASLRGPDGRREWLLDGRLERETAEGGFEAVPMGPRQHPWLQQPWGWHFNLDGATAALEPGGDPQRDVVRLGVRTVAKQVRVDATRGLTRGPAERGAPRPWHLVDLRSGATSPAPGLEPTDRNVVTLGGDALLAIGTAADDLAIVDLGSGARRPVRVDLPAGVDITNLWVLATRPDGQLVVTVGAYGPVSVPTSGHAVLSPARATLDGFVAAPAGSYRQVLALDGDVGAYGLDGGRRIVRVRWGVATPEVLFPRAP